MMMMKMLIYFYFSVNGAIMGTWGLLSGALLEPFLVIIAAAFVKRKRVSFRTTPCTTTWRYLSCMYFRSRSV